MRLCIFKACLQLMEKEVERYVASVEAEQKAKVTKNLADCNAISNAALEQILHRAKPRHATYAEKKTWCWGFMHKDNVDPPSRALVESLAEIRGTALWFSHQHTQDGPIVKWLRGWLQKKHNGTDGDDDMDDDAEDGDEDEHGSTQRGARKRGRNGRR